MLDKIQKFLGCPDRISTVWFITTIIPYFIILDHFVKNLGYNNIIFSDGVIGAFILNFLLLLKYASHVEKSNKHH